MNAHKRRQKALLDLWIGGALCGLAFIPPFGLTSVCLLIGSALWTFDALRELT